MKLIKSLLIVLCLSMSFIIGNAQKTKPSPPPVRKGVTTVVGTTTPPTPLPPPKIAGEYDDKSWKEFINENCGFKLLAIGSPTTNESGQEIDYGTVKNTTFIWQTSVAQYNVICTDYPYLPTDSESIKKSYDFIRDDFVKRGLKVILEKDVSLENYLGRELILETGNSRIRTRLFYVGNRRYQITFGSTSTNPDSKSFTTFYDTTSNKFLDSFKLTDASLSKAASEIAASKAPNPFDAAEFKGRVENSTYINDFLELTFKLPEKWNKVSDDEFSFAFEKGLESFSNNTPTAKKMENIARKNVRTLIGISREKFGAAPNNSNLVCVVERLEVKSMNTSSYVKIGRKLAIESMKNVETVGDITWTKLGGKEFGVFILQMQKDDSKINVNYYLTVHKGVGIGFIFTYFSEEDKQIIETTLKSLSFK